MVRETSAIPEGLRVSVPLKITSTILEPRNALADCSPRTQRMESEMLLFPHPFGPTTAEMPDSKASTVGSTKDLKPWNSIFFSSMKDPLGQKSVFGDKF